MIVLASLTLSGVVVGAPIPITGPVVITVPGEYYLANSIINNNAGVCIDITVPNVVLDGKGKMIDGIDKTDAIGIRVWNAGMALFNVVIKNVVTSDWGTGVYLSGVKNSQLEKITVSSNTGNGISLNTALRNTIKTCTAIENGGVGIILYGNSDSNTLTGNTATGNTLDGIRLRFSSNNDVLNNKVLNNQGPGIYFLEAGNFNTVTGNTITGNKEDGIKLWKSSSNLINKNTLKDNANGILLDTDSYNNEISQNTIQNSTFDGVYLFSNSDNNLVSGNTIEKSLNTGISLFSSDRNTIYNNLVQNNNKNGIWMFASGSNVIVNNYFYNANNAKLLSDLPANRWNLTQSAQKSITGGANSGGNSWGQPNGQGFSQITPATNGICNTPYTLATNNVDKLPLKWAKK
jgi:parallel beta-helix repeat protein